MVDWGQYLCEIQVQILHENLQRLTDEFTLNDGMVSLCVWVQILHENLQCLTDEFNLNGRLGTIRYIWVQILLENLHCLSDGHT